MSNLRTKSVKLRSKATDEMKVARLLSQSNKTVQQTWSTFQREHTVTVADPPANRSERPTRVLATVDLLASARSFVQKRCATRTHTVAKDVLQHLCENDLLVLDEDDEGAYASALRATQRFIKQAGFKRGKPGESRFKISHEHAGKRDGYIREMLRDDADDYRDVYTDESYVHLNYAQHEDSLYDSANPNPPKDKHKGQRLCFIAAVVDKDRSTTDGAIADDCASADSTGDSAFDDATGATVCDAADATDGVTDATYSAAPSTLPPNTSSTAPIDTTQEFLIPESIDIFHGMFDHEYYDGWMDRLISALKKHGLHKCRIIMDNAKYHQVLPSSVPRKKERKAVLARACKEFEIPVTENDHKSDLWANLDEYVKAHILPVILQKAKDAGHKVVFTPPCFSDLQPIEYVWAIVKGEVGRQYTTETKFADIRPRLENALHNVQPGSVQGCIDKARARLFELRDHVTTMDEVSESDGEGSDSDDCNDSDSSATIELDDV